MNIRTPLALLVSGLLVACGGGGGDPDPGNGTPSADQQRAQEILEHCGNDAIAALLDTLDVFAISPTSTDVPITLQPLVGDSIPFTADLDGDMQDDLAGAIRFIDAAGDPLTPFTQDQLNGGIDALIALLATLPDGTKISIDLAPLTPGGLEVANLTILMSGGLPVSVDGLLNYFEDPCVANLAMTNVSTLGLLGAVPTLSALLTAEESGDALAGTVAFNGTNTARIDVALNEGNSMAFALNLTTGAVTPLGG